MFRDAFTGKPVGSALPLEIDLPRMMDKDFARQLDVAAQAVNLLEENQPDKQKEAEDEKEASLGLTAAEKIANFRNRDRMGGGMQGKTSSRKK